MWDWTSIGWLCSEQLSPCWPTRAAYVPASSPGAPAVFAACGFLFFAAMIHLDISSSQTAFIARSAQRLPRHAMQVRSGMAMRAVRELGTLWKRGLQVSQCHSASNFSESRSSSCCNKECQCHKVPPGMAISSFAGPGGLRSECCKCHCSVYCLKQLPLFSKPQCSSPLQSCKSSWALRGIALKCQLTCDFLRRKVCGCRLFTFRARNWKHYARHARHGVGWTHAGPNILHFKQQALRHYGTKRNHVWNHMKSPAKDLNRPECSLEARGKMLTAMERRGPIVMYPMYLRYFFLVYFIRFLGCLSVFLREHANSFRDRKYLNTSEQVIVDAFHCLPSFTLLFLLSSFRILFWSCSSLLSVSLLWFSFAYFPQGLQCSCSLSNSSMVLCVWRCPQTFLRFHVSACTWRSYCLSPSILL